MKQYRGKNKLYHQTHPQNVPGILRDGLKVEYSAAFPRCIWLRKGDLFYINSDMRIMRITTSLPDETFYTMSAAIIKGSDMEVFEVDLKGISSYNVSYGNVLVYQDIPPENLRLLSCQEKEALMKTSITTSQQSIM